MFAWELTGAPVFYPQACNFHTALSVVRKAHHAEWGVCVEF